MLVVPALPRREFNPASATKQEGTAPPKEPSLLQRSAARGRTRPPSRPAAAAGELHPAERAEAEDDRRPGARLEHRRDRLLVVAEDSVRAEPKAIWLMAPRLPRQESTRQG